MAVRQTADSAWRVGYTMEGEEDGGIKGWVTAITKDGVENFKVKLVQQGTPRQGGGKSKATNRNSVAGKAAAAKQESDASKAAHHAAHAAAGDEATKLSAANALKEKRAAEERERLAKEAAEKKEFEEKVRDRCLHALNRAP